MPSKRRKVIYFGLALLLSISMIFMLIQIRQKHTFLTRISFEKQTLPNFTFYNLDSIATNNSFIKKGVPVVLFYYNADCEFCQFEAVEINQNISFFKDAQIIMVSSNTLRDIKAFAKQYGLIYPNITLLQDPKYEFVSLFGKTSVPSVFIYNTKHQLVKEYHGETKIEAILKHF